MPMFEYQCTSCGNEFEELVRGTGAQRVHCPQCGSVDTRRLLSSPCLHDSAQVKAMRGAAIAPRPRSPMAGGGCGSGGFT